MLLIYGNKYTTNEEEWHGERPTDKDMLGATLDYLDSMQWMYSNEDLPNDWRDSLFWRIEE